MKNQLRNFAGSDAYLLEQSAVLQELFENDQALFTAMDTALNSDFKTAWKTAHLAALNQPDDSTIVAQQSQKTAELLNLAKQAGTQWRVIKYFVQKAFPNNAPILAEFGSSEYYNASRKTERMVMFLDELLISCNKYKAALIKAGLPNTVIRDLSRFKEQFQTANTEQELFKRTRLVATQTRIDHFNEVYGFVNQVVAAAAIIFADDAARKSQYVFNPGSTQNANNDLEVYSDTVDANQLKEVVEIIYKPERLVDIENTGAVALSFYLSLDGNISELAPIILDAGRSISLTMSQIANSGDKLMVMNENDMQGSYTVTLSTD